MFIATLFTIVKTWKQPKQRDKEDTVHMYNRILSSHKKNEIGSFVAMWVDLKSVIQSEVRKKKIKYHILRHVCRSQKNSTDEPMCRIGIETQTWRIDMWTQVGKGRVG